MADKADARRAAAVSEALPTFGVGAVVALMGVRGFTATKSIPRSCPPPQAVELHWRALWIDP
jgi:hypothetical protein